MKVYVILAGLAVASSLASANYVSPVADREASSELATKRDIASFEGAKISVRDAVAIAEKQAEAGKVLEVSFKLTNNTPTYDARTYRNGEVWEGLIDAETGKIIGTGKTTREDVLDAEDKAELAGLANATMLLGDAVRMAEAHTGGKAMSAGVEEMHGRVGWEVVIVKNGTAQTIVVDPNTGSIRGAT